MKAGVICQRPGASPFIFCITENIGRAAALRSHHAIQAPGLIWNATDQLPDDACTGDYCEVPA